MIQYAGHQFWCLYPIWVSIQLLPAPFSTPLLINVHKMSSMMVQVYESLTLMWVKHTNLGALGISRLQPWQLWLFGQVNQKLKKKISVSPFLSNIVLESNKKSQQRLTFIFIKIQLLLLFNVSLCVSLNLIVFNIVSLQVECHPYLNQRKLLDFCKSKEIALVAYGALGSNRNPKWQETKQNIQQRQQFTSNASVEI